MEGDDGRPSRGLVLRARDPASDVRSRRWRGGQRRQREEAGRRQWGGWSGRRWGGGGGVVGGATMGVRRMGSCCALAALRRNFAPGCKIMPAEGCVRCPGTFYPPPALREGCSNLGRTGGKGGRALLVASVTIADLFSSCVGVYVVRTGSDVGTLTNELGFRGSEIFNWSKLL